MRTSSSRIITTALAGLATMGVNLSANEAHAGSVSGRVVDKAGTPMTGLTVKVWDIDPGRRKLMAQGKTDAKGNFKVSYPSSYREPGDMFGGGTFPDIHVTVEAQARYGTRNYQKTSATSLEHVPGTGVGRETTIHDWPAFKKWLPDVDPASHLKTGTIRLNAVDRWEIGRTGFDPAVHGLGYTNNHKRKVCWGPTCNQSPWKELFGTQQNLCGGFAVTAFKRFVAGHCDTFETYGPRDATLPAKIKEEIVRNQLATFFFDTWLRDQDPLLSLMQTLLSRPLNLLPTSYPGIRFFEWQAKTDKPNAQIGNTIGASSKIEWPKIQQQIRDRKLPVVLGLINAQAARFNLADIDLVTKNHQVLVIGYDHNPLFRSVTLYIYEPNAPGKVEELRFNYKLDKSRMYVSYSADKRTRGFFMNTVAPKEVVPPVKCGKPGSPAKGPTSTPSTTLALGQTCSSNAQCQSKRCDAGSGTTQTSRCIPNDGTGSAGVFCTHNNHCRTGTCSANKCTAKQSLGATCSGNSECTSNRCDAAPGNPRKCIPNDGTGKRSDYCTHNNQCRPGSPCNLAPGKRFGKCG